MLIHLSFANPLAPLLVLAGALAVGGIVFVIAQECYIRFQLRTRERYRTWRRSTPSGKFLVGLSIWMLATLGCTLAYTIVDIAIYRTNVEQLRSANLTSEKLSVAAAEQLLGNHYGYLVKPVVAGAQGLVGETKLAGGEQLTLRKLAADTYKISARTK